MDEKHFLDRLTPARRELMAQVSAQLAAQTANYGKVTQRFVFPAAPLEGHVWSDARDVFWRTADDFASALREDELPLLFIGCHDMNRITRKREGLGFLLTDQTILVLNPRGFSAREPIVFVLRGRSTAAEAAETFEWKWLSNLAKEEQTTIEVLQAQLTQVLVEATATVLAATLRTDEPAPQRQTAHDIPGRLRELGLTDKVKLGADPKHAKHLAKLGKKLGLPASERIVVAISDATFAGPYGTIITDSSIHSRDLMEDPAPPTPRATIDPETLEIDKGVLALGPGQAHAIPPHPSDPKQPSLLRFLRELFAGQLDEA